MRSRVTSSFLERLNDFLGLSPELDLLLLSQYLGVCVDSKDLYPSKTFKVDKNTVATHEIAPAVSGLRILVDGGVLMAASDVGVTLYSGSTALSGEFPLASNVGFIVSPLVCNRGDSFQIALDGAVQVSGYVTVRYVDFD